LFRRVVFFLFCFVLIAVRERVRRTAKVPFFAVRPIPAARQSPLDAVSSGVPSVTPAVPSVTFVCRAPHVTHDKVCSPCVIEEGARQREFTVKKLPCALCCALSQKTHGKAFAVRFLAFAVRPRRTAKHVFPVVGRSHGSRGDDSAMDSTSKASSDAMEESVRRE
jgi:hypothetical protein